MPANVNLDALIRREDFEVVTSHDDAPAPSTITVRDMETGSFFYPALRKPDFQRATSEWEPRRVVGLIETFLQGDLIPPVILWRNRELLFVIDGSHRLSALLAWINDDYGDGEGSQKYFCYSIPVEQLEQAKKTREAVVKAFGTYEDHKKAASAPELFGPDMVVRARALASRVLNIQWVKGDAKRAEDSFVRINQRAATVTPRELSFITGRREPAVIAARAIVGKGTGHQYSSGFATETQENIKSLAEEVHNLLFEPSLTYPIRSLELPVGGSSYSATTLSMVRDFVELSAGAADKQADKNGARTIEYLKRCRRVAEMVLSTKAHSMGLHPAFYFYSWTGKQQPILFLVMI